jgi:structure-specific recognition protein 1
MLQINDWGKGQDLAFLVSNKTIFEIPLSTVSNSNIAGRTEVSLEFSGANGFEKKIGKQPDELAEIRFYVPGSSKDLGSDIEDVPKKKKTQQDGEAEGEDIDSDEEEEEQTAAQQFHTLVRDRASISNQTAAGSLIVSFEDILISTPRGRYDVDLYKDFLRSVSMGSFWCNGYTDCVLTDYVERRTITKFYTAVLRGCWC